MKGVIVCLHGFGEDHRVWDDFIPPYTWPYPVLSPNYADWTDCSSTSDYANKIVSSLPQDQPWFLIGHSMGGYVALAFAKLYPQQVKAVVMLNSTATADSDEKKLNRNKTIDFLNNWGTKAFIGPFVPQLFTKDFAANQASLIQNLIQRYQSIPAEGLMAASAAMRDRAAGFDLLASTQIPFLFIHGDQDSIVSLEDVKRACATSNLHRMVRIPNSGHQSAYEAPDEVHSTIVSFINTLHV